MIRRCMAALALTATFGAQAQGQPDTATLLAAQGQAMAPLAMLDGTWRGSARLYLEGGKTRELVQTERVGPMLGGSVKVIEGRSYGAEGQVEFNALAIVSFDPQSGRYTLHAQAQGRAGDFNFEPRPDGFVWTVKMGPVTIRHSTVVQGGRWEEVTERLMDGQPPTRLLEMSLRRLGDSDWPAAGAVPMR